MFDLLTYWGTIIYLFTSVTTNKAKATTSLYGETMFNLFNARKQIHDEQLYHILTFDNGKRVEVMTQINYNYGVFITYNIKRQTQYTWGNTPDESLEKFKQLYIEYINNIKKRGRKKKANVVLYCRLPAEIKDCITNYCEHNKMNMAQFIAQLIEIHKSQQA